MQVVYNNPCKYILFEFALVSVYRCSARYTRDTDTETPDIDAAEHKYEIGTYRVLGS